ncbi:SDR family NAD(P)-dependent oxidoreductase [Colwellia sp. MSW7]|uniref:SDR family NAD(P)-dependent oxidoreductase n=1 Tax=Colwellia maritima TaxID=2912588 RepID=A0ABS9X398_9GAMM|nr:SDR family NAD(P)-dependent oxidoreductase [Colwellia maritima]MCI2284720.1 SDR family NAD(P)-dependent oxidoreductase [Colwellia maritima]
MKLINKKIVLTGGTSGIGLKLVEMLYPENTLYIIARNEDKINKLQNKYPNIIALKADLTKLYEVEAVAKNLCSQTSNIDVLINNAAIQYTPSFSDNNFTLDSINDEISVNLTSLCSLCYLLLPLLNNSNSTVSKKTAILNVNSGLALAPKKSSAIYCATKSAVDSFSKSLRLQLENTGIEVLQAFLPVVDTPMTYGRGKKKMSIEDACNAILKGLEKGIANHDIGKVKLLRILQRLFPAVASNIMRGY